MSQDKETAAKLRQIGIAVRRERTKRGLSQEVLAELCNIDVRSLQRIEGGELNLRALTLIRIHKALDCGWEGLLPK